MNGTTPVRAAAIMGTVVTIHAVRADAPGADEAVERAFGWFYEIEERCTRFDERSELRQLMALRPGTAFAASAMLFEAVRFARMAAEETAGAFDPTTGSGSFADIEIDEARKAITLRRELTLDLGALAKGLAVDMAARELTPFRDFAIDAGGDLYLGGFNAQGEAWPVGIRHPRRDGEVIETVRVSDRAVCTSGDYERGRHIIGAGATVASATVIAPNAMLADALATAAFVLGPGEGIALLERMGLDGLIVTPELERFETRGLPRAA